MNTPRHQRTPEAAEYYFEEGCYILEYLNDPDDLQASIARARLPEAGVTDWHRLIDTTERYLILAGEGRAEIGPETFEVRAGDVVVIPPETPQRIANTGTGDLTFLAICTPRFRPECYRRG
ncbi:MAG: cupin domain-containing protein [Pseudomonadota bacterium]